MERRCVLAALAAHTPAVLDDGTLDAHRRRLLHRAEGRVLDLSARWAPNVAAYRRGALSALCVVDPTGRGRVEPPVGVPAARRLAEAGDAPAHCYDHVVVTFTLCAAPDPVGLLRAAVTHLAPGGRLLVLEHVRGTGLTGLVQHLAGPVGRRVRTGCRLDLDLAAAAVAADLDIVDGGRFRLLIGAAVPAPCLAAVLRPARPIPSGAIP
jgi:hypothetical protein